VLFEESDVRAWIKAQGIPAGRGKDADRGTGWWPTHRARRSMSTKRGAAAAMSPPAPTGLPPDRDNQLIGS